MWPLPSGLIAKAAIGVVLALGAFLYGLSVGINRGNVKIAQAETKALAIKAQETAALAETISNNRNQYEATIDSLNDANAKLLASVQRRPNRPMPGASAPVSQCAAPEGSTGAELYRPDAAFLVGFATETGRLADTLTACYADNDALREALAHGAESVP